MKRYTSRYGTTGLMIGSAREIRSLEATFYERWINEKSHIGPSHCDRPKFNSDRMYGLCIDYDEGTYMVVSASTALRLLTEYDFVED